ncbi:MAG: nucleotidyltransferase family protein [Acidobacteria bacterium]|nr:nucleotidyltransferase family protein [Acidobacteriota bacterium]
MRLLAAVRDEGLPDAWVAAGALRNLVWDRLHDFEHRHPPGDVDVVYYDAADASRERDQAIEKRLAERLPGLPWEVVNQAWIHEYNGEEPYTSTLDALSRWTETCTSVAARLSVAGEVEILAPHGVADLMAMIGRPNLIFANAAEIFTQRMASKLWSDRWPKVRVLGLDRQRVARPGV